MPLVTKDDRLAKTVSTCHPPSKAANAAGLCLECVLDAKAERLHSQRLLAGRCHPVAGVVQYAYVEPPDRCPHCRQAKLVIDRDMPRRLYCASFLGGCGADLYLVDPNGITHLDKPSGNRYRGHYKERRDSPPLP